ncbi:DUF4311 domain-containing protein [Paenibacillus flagellatus]|uniref:DUF4311 domain-containing protein n=1 Tax=Paenibacillus flagellatus TaxID=2211139 RepID=A0A2V5K0D0_9BACL|nr:DUF4311 domain-containing protein [Paenibacillus flagellatus]PYI52665.1 hypothetical protein DLM86_21095 [Paenibacillus flagellatus]
MEFAEFVLKSLAVGALAGFGLGAGIARMFHVPDVQGMGAFRAMGELNACEGSAKAHAKYGLTYFVSSLLTVLGTGALTQDVNSRTVPHWAAAILFKRRGEPEEALYDPRRMAIAGALLGMIVVAVLNGAYWLLPQATKDVAEAVLVPAARWFVHPVMPAIFWLAAMDAGKRTGVWATALGGVSHFVLGNAVPGIMLGIFVGKRAEDIGWNRATIVWVTLIIAALLTIGFVREIDLQLLRDMKATAPSWLTGLHEWIGTGGGERR